jgi:hypothetical protein
VTSAIFVGVSDTQLVVARAGAASWCCIRYCGMRKPAALAPSV